MASWSIDAVRWFVGMRFTSVLRECSIERPDRIWECEALAGHGGPWYCISLSHQLFSCRMNHGTILPSNALPGRLTTTSQINEAICNILF